MSSCHFDAEEHFAVHICISPPTNSAKAGLLLVIILFYCGITALNSGKWWVRMILQALPWLCAVYRHTLDG